MIDLHCHILPGIDDGPPTIEASVALARALVADGTQTVAATPHLRSDHPAVVVGELADRCAELRAALADAEVPLEVVSGAEVDLLWAHRASRDELALACYAGRGTDLLLETPYGPLPPGFAELLDELSQAGFRVLLAHPERNAAFQRTPGEVAKVAEAGVLVQVTAASLALDPRQSKSARVGRGLVGDGVAHVVSSDLHGTEGISREPLSAGVAAASDVAGDAVARWMVTDAPRAVLDGRPLPPAPAQDARSGGLARLRRAFR